MHRFWLASVVVGALLAGRGRAQVFPFLEQGRWGAHDAAGKVLLPPQYDEIAPIGGGWYRLKLGNAFGVIDDAGQVLLRTQYPKMGLRMGSNLVPVADGRGWFFAGVGNRDAFKLRFEEVGPFVDGRARVKLDGAWGMLDASGNYFIAPQFEAMGDYADGWAPVSEQGRWTFVSEGGRLLTKPQYDTAGSFTQALAPVKQYGAWGFVDKTGKMGIEFMFEEARQFSEGRAAVAVNRRWGFVDKSGTYTVVPRYDEVHDYRGNRAAARLGATWLLLDEGGLPVGRGKFDRAPRCQTEAVGDMDWLWVACQNGKCGFLDAQGKWVLEPRFDDAEPFRDGLARVRTGTDWCWVRPDGRCVRPPSH